MAKLSAILDQIDGGTMLLPEFQRGYVWNRDQFTSSFTPGELAAARQRLRDAGAPARDVEVPRHG